MRSIRFVVIISLAMLALVGCRRDPNVAKKSYLESGNRYFEKGRYKEAEIQYGNAVKIDRKFGPAHYKLALTYLKVSPPKIQPAVKAMRTAVELLRDNQAYQTEYRDALVKLSEIYLIFGYNDKTVLDDVQKYAGILLKKDPESFDGHRLLGDWNYVNSISAGKVIHQEEESARLLDAALVEYRKADSIKSGEVGVSYSMARALRDKKDYRAAEEMFRRVIAKDKSAGAAYRDLYYQLYTLEGKAADAEQVLKLGVQNNPKVADYLETLAFHYGLQGRRDDMLGVLQQIKSHAKEWKGVYQTVGDFYLRIGDGESALREYREGSQKEPKDKLNYQHRIIEVLMRQGKRAEAAEVNAQILKDDPKDSDARSLAASFLLDKGDISKALSELQSVVTRNPENAVARYQLGRAYLAHGEREPARTQLEKSISLRGDMLLPRLELAGLQVLHQEYQAALESVKEILKLDPGNINAKLIESQAYLGQKRYGESQTLMDAMAKSNPSSPDVFYQVGVSYMEQGKLKEAEGAFQRAYELNPANPRALLGVVEVDIRMGKPEAGMALLQAESRKSPNRLDLPLLMGTTAVRQGKFQDALDQFQRVLNGLDKNAKVRGEIYMRIAEAYRLKGDPNSSIASLQKAREVDPENEMVLFQLGLALDLGGRKNEAKPVYEACIRVNPNNFLALNNLAFLVAETNGDLNRALSDAQKANALQPGMAEISDTLGWIYLKMGQAEQAINVFKELVGRAPAQSTYRFHLAMAYKQKAEKAKAIVELKEALTHNPSKEEQTKIMEMLTQLGG